MAEYADLADEDDPPRQRSFLSTCCSTVTDVVARATGCKDPEWLSLKVLPDEMNDDQGVALYVAESDWSRVGNCVFFPCEPRKAAFDFAVMVCVVFSCMVIPYRIAFDDEAGVTVDLFVQGIFCLDLVFSFNTAYLLQEKWIVHRPSIARNYLRGWFWIDAPASLPLVELLSLIKDVDGDEHNQQFLLRAFRLARLFRLLRLLKMLKLGSAVRSFEFATGLSLSNFHLVNILLLTFAFTHVSACVFYAISEWSSGFYSNYWARFFDENGDGALDEGEGGASPMSPFEKYTVALAWAVSDVFGLQPEIAAENHIERMAALIISVMATLLFALIVAVVTQQFFAFVNDPFKVSMAEVDKFCRFHRVPRGLHEKTTAFFEAVFTHTPIDREPELLAKMTPTLQEHMWTHLLATTIKQCTLLAKVAESEGSGKLGKMFGDPRAFHIGVYKALRYVTYAPREMILIKDQPNDTLLFLRKGEVHASVKGRYLFSLTQVGASCGERCLLEPQEGELIDYDARFRCDLLALNRAQLLATVAEHLVPAHRLKLATDIFGEMLRKGEQTRTALKGVIAGAHASDKHGLLDVLNEIGGKMDALKETHAKDALHAIVAAEELVFNRSSMSMPGGGSSRGHY